MTVGRQQLLLGISDAEAGAACSELEGLFGPESATWQISRESVIFLGGATAALLQLAHPYVAAGVDQHSATREDPIGRFNRTFTHVFAMVFGDRESARRAARRVHAIHTKIHGELTERVGRFARGHHYEANDEEALLWVHATLIHTALQVHDLIRGPMDRQIRAQYYEESRRFARLFGIPDALIPATLPAFERYFQEMVQSDSLGVGRPAADIGRFLLQPPNRRSRPLVEWGRVMTAGLLPDRFRREFGLSFNPLQRAFFRASVRGVRVGYARIPSRLRYVPAYVEAERRLQGLDGPDHFGRALERFVLRGVTPKRDGCPMAARG